MNNYNFPFQKYEIDLTNQTFENRLINLSGNILIVANNIVPVGIDSQNNFVKPSIKFNTQGSPKIELNPFSVFQVNFERLFLDSYLPFTDQIKEKLTSTKLILLSSNIENINLMNFRTVDSFQVSGELDPLDILKNAITLTIPSGAKNASVAIKYNTDATDFKLNIRAFSHYQNSLTNEIGYNRLVEEVQDGTNYELLYSFPCEAYATINLFVSNINGSPTFFDFNFNFIFTE